MENQEAEQRLSWEFVHILFLQPRYSLFQLSFVYYRAKNFIPFREDNHSWKENGFSSH